MEQRIKLAAKLYQCRDTAKGLFGEKYAEKLAPYTECLKGAMKLHECDEIQAAFKVAAELKGKEGEGMGMMMIMAAAVEIMEPTEKAPAESKEGGI